MNNGKTKESTKLFFSGVIVLTVSNLLIKVIGAMFKIPMNHIIGDLGMGYYGSAYSIYTLFYMISTAGLPVAISLLVSENRAKGRIDQVKRVSKIAMILFICIGTLGCGIMFFGSDWLAGVIKADPTSICIKAIAPVLFFICIASAIRGYFQGYQYMVPVAVSQLIEALCKLFLGIAFAKIAIAKYGSGSETIPYVAAYAVLGVTVGAGLGMLFLIASRAFFKSAKYDAEYTDVVGENHDVEPTGKIVKRIILIALPVTISASVLSLTNTIDMALIQRLLQSSGGMTQVEATAAYGNYNSLCVPLFNMPPYLIYPIGYSLVPLIKATVVSGDRSRAQKIMESTLRVAVLIGLPCGIGMAALSDPILRFLGYREVSVSFAAPLLSFLAPSIFFLCILAITNSILQANGRERKPVISMLIGAIVKIVSNVLLTPVIGIYGTPISTFLCYLTATGLNFFFVLKYTKLKVNFISMFFKPLVSTVISVLGAVSVYYVFDGKLGVRISLLMALAVAIVLYFIVNALIKTVTDEDLKIIPKAELLIKLIKRLKKPVAVICVLAVLASAALAFVVKEKEPDIVDFNGTWNIVAVNVGGAKSTVNDETMTFSAGEVSCDGDNGINGKYENDEQYLSLTESGDKYLIEDVTDEYARLNCGLENYIDIIRVSATEITVDSDYLEGKWSLEYGTVDGEYETAEIIIEDGNYSEKLEGDSGTIEYTHSYTLDENGILSVEGREVKSDEIVYENMDFRVYPIDENTAMFVEKDTATVWKLAKSEPNVGDID